MKILLDRLIVISGGQTGVDQAALKIARKHGIRTGGCAPRGWRTDEGPAPWLADYGLIEHASADYKPRTRQNVRDSNVTFWFGKLSPGFKCTWRAAEDLKKPFYANSDTAFVFQYLLHLLRAGTLVINVAGNRQRTNPDAAREAEEILDAVFAHLGKL